MVMKNAKNRTPQNSGRRKRSKPEGRSKGLGSVSDTSREHGTYQIGAGGEDSDKSDTAITGESTDYEVSGKIASQLINEAEKNLAYHEEQLAYHAQQVEVLKKRVQELKQISSFNE